MQNSSIYRHIMGRDISEFNGCDFSKFGRVKYRKDLLSTGLTKSYAEHVDMLSSRYAKLLQGFRLVIIVGSNSMTPRRRHYQKPTHSVRCTLRI